MAKISAKAANAFEKAYSHSRLMKRFDEVMGQFPKTMKYLQQAEMNEEMKKSRQDSKELQAFNSIMYGKVVP